MSGLWDNETCLTLIDAYESKRVLWDSTYEEYYNRIKKEDAWRDISDTLNISVDDVKKIIVSLTGSFRRERSKQKRSSKTVSGQDQAYVSKWFAFDWMKFLMDKSEPNETRDSSNDNRTKDVLDVENADNQGINDNEASSEMRPPNQKSAKKKKIEYDNPMADMGNYSPNVYCPSEYYNEPQQYGYTTSTSTVSSPPAPPSPTLESTNRPSPAETAKADNQFTESESLLTSQNFLNT
ncbi:unnamed protein product [Arctia plantaginis]|uniref:MADF domain-containing protein n=1 Tax=Arctia plantaginis TaxID=874455 RepID=A0A8S0YTV7_ARCPL|nr:unnamed protein product [Arctia plantaginis]